MDKDEMEQMDLIISAMEYTLKKIVEDPTIAKLQAKQAKITVDALMEEGFTKGEAITIFCASLKAVK